MHCAVCVAVPQAACQHATIPSLGRFLGQDRSGNGGCRGLCQEKPRGRFAAAAFLGAAHVCSRGSDAGLVGGEPGALLQLSASLFTAPEAGAGDGDGKSACADDLESFGEALARAAAVEASGIVQRHGGTEKAASAVSPEEMEEKVW